MTRKFSLLNGFIGHESVLRCFQNHYTKNTNGYLKVFTDVESFL